MTNKTLPDLPRHDYLTGNDGARIPLTLLGELCPLCGVSHPDAQLGILREDAFSQTVMCSSCDYILTRPRRLVPGRLMNSRREDE